MSTPPSPFSIKNLRRGKCLINGVRFRLEVRDRILTNKITFDEIMQFRNIEQRRAAIQYIGMNQLLKTGNFDLFDKSERGNRLYVSGEPYFSKYHREEWLSFLAYECPSTSRPYVSAVDIMEAMQLLKPETNELVWKRFMAPDPRERAGLRLHGVLADAAMAWKLSLTLDEYRSMTAEA